VSKTSLVRTRVSYTHPDDSAKGELYVVGSWSGWLEEDQMQKVDFYLNPKP
jgi:hypothetical protein